MNRKSWRTSRSPAVASCATARPSSHGGSRTSSGYPMTRSGGAAASARRSRARSLRPSGLAPSKTPRTRCSRSTSSTSPAGKTGSPPVGLAVSGRRRPCRLSWRIWLGRPVRNFQWSPSAPAPRAWSASTAGVSRSGSALRLTKRTSSQPSAPCSSSCSSRSPAVTSGQTSVHRVEVRCAIQTRPPRSAEPNGAPVSSVRENEGTSSTALAARRSRAVGRSPAPESAAGSAGAPPPQPTNATVLPSASAVPSAVFRIICRRIVLLASRFAAAWQRTILQV